jgi:hypothetical protein
LLFFRRTFTPTSLTVPLLAFALYAVHGGTASVTGAAFSSSSLAVSNATQPPLVFLGTTAFSMTFSYAAGAVLRAVTETRVITGVARSIILTGAVYTVDMARLWIIQIPLGL